MTMASPLEKTSADLKVARFVVHKLGETFDSFQVHSYSIFSLVEQWRNLQASFADVNKSLEGRVKELESKEREFGIVANKLQSFQKEVELKRKSVEFGEKSLSERIAEVELRQNEVKKWLEIVEMQKIRISEREKVVEVKERELAEGLKRVKTVDDDEIRVRKVELEVNECRRVVELEQSRVSQVVEELESREKQIDERCKNVELRESRVGERCKAVEFRENRVDERCKELELREREIKEREEALEVRETGLNEDIRVMEAKEDRLMKDYQALELREEDMDKIYRLLELRENEINERFKEVESKEKELRLREEEMKVQLEELKSKERDIIDRLNTLKVEEKGLRDGCRALKDKENEINVRFASLEVREEEVNVSFASLEVREEDVNKRSHDVEVKEMQVNAERVVLEAKEGALNDHSEMLELKGKEVDARGKAMELKEKEVEELRRGVELKEKQMNESLQGLQLKQMQIDERCKEMEEKGKEISQRIKEIEMKEKQINRRKKAQELREKHFEDSLKAHELKEREANGCYQMLDHKEKQYNELPEAPELKDEQFNEVFQVVESKEKKLNGVSQAQESIEEQCNDGPHVRESNEEQCNDLPQTLKLKEKQINEPSEALESKRKQINELSQELESKEKQRDEFFVCDHDKVFELKDKEINVPCEATELNGKQVNQHHGTQKLDTEKKKMCSDKLELKGKQTADGAMELKLNQTNQPNTPAFKEGQKSDIAHESRDKQIAELQKVIELKENQVNDKARKLDVGQKQSHNCDSNLVVNSNGSEGGASTFLAKDGKTLQVYLNERVHKHGSMKGEVAKVLKSTSNPAKLVLGAMDGFFSPHLSKDGVAFEASVVRSSCLLLLEHLMKMKHGISRALKKEATMVAIKWRAKMRVQGESEDVVLAFLLLLVTYNLNTLVKKDDLRRLCGMVGHHRLAPHLRQRLGLLERITVSSCSEDAIKEPIQSDSLQIANAQDSSSVKIPGDIHSLCRSMDENGVRSYLIEHVKEYNVLHDKILDALRYASDPAKLVLDVCQISVTDRDKNRADVNNATCIFLLKQLMNLSPSITDEVTNEAKDFAAFLKARLTGSITPEDHYRFLQFLASYKLASSYNPDELLSYFKVFYCGEEVYRPDENPHLCFALGLVKKIPGIIKSLIDQRKLVSAVKYICVFKWERTFPPVPLLEAHLDIVKKKVDEKLKEGTFRDKIDAEHMESSMLKSILICIYNFKLESQLQPDRFIARIKELEKEKERRMGATCPRKRSASPRPSIATPLQQEKRCRLGSVQQSQLVSPVYLPPCPPGPPPRPHSFGPPAYAMPMSNGPNMHFNSPGGGHRVVPPLAPGHFMHASPPGIYPGGAPIHSHIENDPAWTAPNQWRF